MIGSVYSNCLYESGLYQCQPELMTHELSSGNSKVSHPHNLLCASGVLFGSSSQVKSSKVKSSQVKLSFILSGERTPE